MNFRYKITDLTPHDRFVPPEIVNVGSTPRHATLLPPWNVPLKFNIKQTLVFSNANATFSKRFINKMYLFIY